MSEIKKYKEEEEEEEERKKNIKNKENKEGEPIGRTKGMVKRQRMAKRRSGKIEILIK